LRKFFNKTERDIDKAELHKSELDTALHNPENATDPGKLAELSKAIQKLDDELESLLQNWESLGSDIAELEG
jgi:hypothetical protein